MKKNFFRLFSTLLLATLILSACGSAAPAPEQRPLKIAMNVWPGDYPIAIAQQQGFFAKHGVEVEIIYYDNYPSALTDYASGTLDGLNFAMGDLLTLLPKRDSKMVLIADSSEGIDEIVALDEIQSMADLKGKRIGVKFGSYGEFFVRELLRMNDIAVTDVTLVNAPAENAAEFFPSQVDVIHTYEPYSTEAMKRGGHILVTSTAIKPLVISSVVAFSADMIKERPEDIRAFAAAYFEAVDWMYAHEAEVPAVVARVLELTPEDIFLGGDHVLTLAENQAALVPGTGAIYPITNDYIKFLAETGRLTIAPKVDELIDPSFLP